MTTLSAPIRRGIDWPRVIPLLMFFAIVVPTAVFLVIQLFNDPSLFFQTLMKSLALGSVYAIIALGFVLIFKATQTVNFAQGALAMVGALFLSFMVADEHIPLTTIHNPLVDIGGPDWIAWALSAIVALAFGAALGLLIERLAIRPMIGKPLFSIAVITLGLEAFFRTFSNDSVKISFRSIDAPWGTWGTDGSGGFYVGDAFINWSYIMAIITALVCFLAVFVFFRTRTGVAMRAVAFDQEVALAQGISVARVFAFAWAAGMILASIGGIFATQPPVAQTGAVQVETQFIAFRALPAVILGGLDSVAGALVGGLIVGAAEIFAGQYASGLTDQLGPGYPVIVPYVVMIIGLLVRPYGLFGTPEIRRV